MASVLRAPRGRFRALAAGLFFPYRAPNELALLLISSEPRPVIRMAFILRVIVVRASKMSIAFGFPGRFLNEGHGQESIRHDKGMVGIFYAVFT